MTLVEMIEALQLKAIEQANASPTNSETGKQVIIGGLRARFAPILAAAREQSRDLAEAVASRNSWKEQWKLRCEMLFKQIDITEKLEKELAAVRRERDQAAEKLAEALRTAIEYRNWGQAAAALADYERSAHEGE